MLNSHCSDASAEWTISHWDHEKIYLLREPLSATLYSACVRYRQSEEATSEAPKNYDLDFAEVRPFDSSPVPLGVLLMALETTKD